MVESVPRQLSKAKRALLNAIIVYSVAFGMRWEPMALWCPLQKQWGSTITEGSTINIIYSNSEAQWVGALFYHSATAQNRFMHIVLVSVPARYYGDWPWGGRMSLQQTNLYSCVPISCVRIIDQQSVWHTIGPVSSAVNIELQCGWIPIGNGPGSLTAASLYSIFVYPSAYIQLRHQIKDQPISAPSIALCRLACAANPRAISLE